MLDLVDLKYYRQKHEVEVCNSLVFSLQHKGWIVEKCCNPQVVYFPCRHSLSNGNLMSLCE